MSIPKATKDKLLVSCLNRCCRCHRDSPEVDVHHIIPVSKGGNHDPSNLIVLCPNCHREAHRYRWSKRQLTLYKEVWISRCSTSDGNRESGCLGNVPIMICVSDYRNFGQRASDAYVGQVYSEEILKCLLQNVRGQQNQAYIAIQHRTIMRKFAYVRPKGVWRLISKPFERLEPKGVAALVEVWAANRANFDSLFDPKMDISIFPERLNPGDKFKLYDPRKIFKDLFAPEGYLGWIFVVGCVSDTTSGGFRAATRAVMFTATREQTIFIQDTEFCENDMLQSAYDLGLALSTAIREYPWGTLSLEISGLLPHLIALLTSRKGPARKRAAAAHTLGYFDSSESTAALIEALQFDRSCLVRSLAAEALGISASQGFVKLNPLIMALEDKDVMTKFNAVRSLIRLTGVLESEWPVGYPPDEEKLGNFICKWKSTFDQEMLKS